MFPYHCQRIGGSIVDIERQFDKAVLEIYHSAKAIGYTPSAFHQMISRHGGLGAAKKLINARSPSEGYTKLWELGRLDISVEAVVHDNPKWHPLFTAEELETCRKRLLEYHYLT